MPGKGWLARCALLVLTVMTTPPPFTMTAPHDSNRSDDALAVTLTAATSVFRGATPAEAAALRIGQPAPDIAGGPWINSEPLTLRGLRGRVVLVEFWTYG
jgi:hypothetical protein